jgi:uncharacterized OsmC-like protein
MSDSTSARTVDNGVDVDALFGARKLVTEQPEAAQFKWRAGVTWLAGTHSRTSVHTFYGFGAEHTHHRAFELEADHPAAFAATDRGATPVELVLAGLASCLTAGIAAVAQARGIQLRAVTATLEAGMDVRGILGADPEVRNGFEGVAVRYRIDADASPEDLQALVAQSQKRSAVYDILTNPTHVVVEVE